MNGEQLHQLAIEAARNLPFSEQTHPFGPEYEVFKILEKNVYADSGSVWHKND